MFPEDRRYAEAFARGGLEAEREEREKVKEEERKRQEDNHRHFMEFLNQARREKEEKDRAALEIKEESSSDIDPKALETYYSSSKGGESSSKAGEDSSSLNKSRTDSKSEIHSESEEEHKLAKQPDIEAAETKSDKVEINFSADLTELD